MSTHRAEDLFDILVREHADLLTVYLRSLVDSSEAVDDLFQETMLTAWRRLGDFDRTRPFGPWLRGIARNLVMKYRERRARDVILSEPAALDLLESRFEELAPTRERFGDLLDRLVTCLERLPGKLLGAIQAVYRNHMTVRSAAEELGASEEAVKKRVQRGRKLLLDCVQGGES